VHKLVAVASSEGHADLTRCKFSDGIIAKIGSDVVPHVSPCFDLDERSWSTAWMLIERPRYFARWDCFLFVPDFEDQS
jgi:hypothetical protein